MGKLPLEGFKFAVYVGLPVLAVTYFQRPDVFRRIIENRNYIQYPPEDERSPEELLEALVRVVDQQRLEAVHLEGLEAEDVQDADEAVPPDDAGGRVVERPVALDDAQSKYLSPDPL